MITVTDLEVRAGARLLMEHVTFRVAGGDKVGVRGSQHGARRAAGGGRVAGKRSALLVAPGAAGVTNATVDI